MSNQTSGVPNETPVENTPPIEPTTTVIASASASPLAGSASGFSPPATGKVETVGVLTITSR